MTLPEVTAELGYAKREVALVAAAHRARLPHARAACLRKAVQHLQRAAAKLVVLAVELEELGEAHPCPT